MVFKTEHWVVSHRKDSRYAGYLIISSKDEVNELHKLSNQTLSELGTVLEITEKLLILAYTPYKVAVAKLGFSSGFNCHFHIIPVTCSLLQEIREHQKYTDDEPDGIDAMLFICREYCEREITQEEQRSIDNTVKSLTNLFNAHFKFYNFKSPLEVVKVDF